MRMVIIFNPRSGRPRPSAPILPLLSWMSRGGGDSSEG